MMSKVNNILTMPIKNIALKVIEYLDIYKKNGWSHFDSSYSSYSSANRTSYYRNPIANTYCTIYFYEFSNINSTPKVFKYKEDFIKWCEENKIDIDENQKKWIINEPIYLFAYGICPQGSNKLILETSKNRMIDSFNKFKDTSNKTIDLLNFTHSKVGNKIPIEQRSDYWR